MSSLLLTKVFCLVSIFCSNLTAGLATFFKIRKRCSTHELSQRLTNFLSIATCFSVGLFMAICFLSLYNSASKKIMMFQSLLSETNAFKNYPLSETLLCLGLFCLWFLEWLGHIFLQKLFISCCDERSSGTTTLVHELYRRDSSEPNSIDSVNEDHVHLLQTGDDVGCVSDNANAHIRRDSKATNSIGINSLLKSLMLTLAMFLHNFLEAIGFGLLDSSGQVFGMVPAMLLHQLLCSSTLGLRLARNSVNNKVVYAFLLLMFYLLALPIGSTIGMILHHHSTQNLYNLTGAEGSPLHYENVNIAWHLLVGIVQNVAAAAFVYVIFVEILPKEINTTMPNPKQPGIRTTRRGVVCCLTGLLGFSVIAVMRLISHKAH